MRRRPTTIAGERLEDDFTIVDEHGDHLGRIMRVNHGPQEGLWFWSKLTYPAMSGFRGTYEAAAAELKAALER